MLVRAHRSAFSWDRSAVLLGVIGLHVAGIYLVSVYGGLGRVVERAAEALALVRLAPDPAVPGEPEPERPRLQEVIDYVPRVPEPLPLPQPEGSAAETITVRVEEHGGGDSGEAVRTPAVPATPLTYRSRRPTDDFYPPVSIRMGEEGAASVRVCVDAGGALQGVPQVTDSSGHPRLDTAAVAWVRDALTFTPATQDGARVAACKAFRVKFTLHQ